MRSTAAQHVRYELSYSPDEVLRRLRTELDAASNRRIGASGRIPARFHQLQHNGFRLSALSPWFYRGRSASIRGSLRALSGGAELELRPVRPLSAYVFLAIWFGGAVLANLVLIKRVCDGLFLGDQEMRSFLRRPEFAVIVAGVVGMPLLF